MIKKSIPFILFLAVWLGLFHPVAGMNADSTASIQKARAHYTRGVILGRQGILDSALWHTQKAIEIMEKQDSGRSISLAHAYQSMGIIRKLSGQYDEALTYYHRAEQIYRQKNETGLLAYIYGNQANIYFIRQDYAKAKDFHLMALDIFNHNSSKYQKQISSTYNNLGNIYRLNHNFIQAIDYYIKSLTLKVENQPTFSTYANLAICYENLGQPQKAEQYYIQAIETIRTHFSDTNLWLSLHYGKYAQFLAKQGRNEKALDYFRKALKINQINFGEKNPLTAESYNQLGYFYHQNRDLEQAIFYYQRALLALANEFNDTSPAANPDIEKVLSKTHLLEVFKNKAIALSEQAIQTQEAELFRQSIHTFDLAIETSNRIRTGYLNESSKLQLVENTEVIISRAIEACYHAYQLENESVFLQHAFRFIESGKSAVLLEAIKGNQALTVGNIPDSLKQQETKLEKEIYTYEELIYEENKQEKPDSRKIAYWSKNLFELKQDYDQLISFLELQYPAYHNLKYNQEIVSLAFVKQKLAPNEVLLEYSYSGSKLYSFMISKEKIRMHEVALNDKFNHNLDFLLGALSDNNFSTHTLGDFIRFQESSYNLYQELIAPFEQEIRHKKLIIIPDNKLAYLPYDILIKKILPSTRINYRQQPYLIKNHQLSYSYSATLLYETRQRDKTASKRLGAFAPTYNNIREITQNDLSIRQQYREKLFPLKGIKEEARNVVEIIGGDSYLDFEAAEETFKAVAPDYDILHLAMHTIIDDENPMYSKMAFTQKNDTTEDGLLNTYEIYNMKLNCRMSVLSSCNSGSGKLHRGEGVISLARGFIYAGCPSIIMTLWSVEDKSGVDLMTRFYQNLKTGQNKAGALRQAKLDFIDHADPLKAHPYFWAGYVVIGDDTPLFHKSTKFILAGVALLILGLSVILFFRRRKKNTSPVV
ncbi:MAG: CHAT domain-containing tetratricopeptide repeat protein [Bacteroidales bacterium]|nr:CHAT domain-containing tetratricopeptide repeat protein [Bacteroidales bacterium]